MVTSTQATTASDPRKRERSLLERLFSSRATWILLLDLVLIGIFTIYSKNNVFFSYANIKSLMLSSAESLLLAVGLSLLLGAGKFDLSLGANLVLSSVCGALVMVTLMSSGVSVPIVILAGFVGCMIAGSVVGALNGVLVAQFGINSLIATLGMLGVCSGVSLVLTHNGQDIVGFPIELQSHFGLNTIAMVPIPALVALLITLIIAAILHLTPYGVRTLALGSSALAAERVGLRVKRHALSLFVLAGALAGIAAFIDLSFYRTTVLNGHPNDALQAVAAAVIGGTALEGGRISLIGTVWGVALAVILLNGLIIIGISSAYQLMAVGLVLILAVGLDRLSAKNR
jgi:ribose transport system permease protein